MNMIKSISKRTLALILSLLMLLSSGIVGTLAANVDLVETGANTVNGGYVYFDNTKTNWSDSCIQFVIGHSSYSRTYTMSKISNTNLYYVSITNATYSTWSDATYYAVIGTSSKWGDGTWGSSNLTNATHRTAAFTTTFNLDGTTKRWLVTPSSSSNGTSISIDYQGTTYGSLNKAQTVYAKSTEYGGSTYSNDANAGTVKVEGYYLSGNSSAASRSAVTTLGTSYTTNASLAAGTQVTLTATVNDGYTFQGWYTSGGTRVSTELTYSYAHSGATATYHARYEKELNEVTATFEDHDGTTLGTDTVSPGSTPTAPADPTREGYTFTGWSDGTTTYTTLPAISADTTFTAQYTPINYPITFVYGVNGEHSTTTDVAYDSTPTAPADDVVEVEGYTFNGWNPTISKVTGETTYTAQYTINTYDLTISGFDSTKATMTIDGTPYTENTTITKEYGQTADVVITPIEGQELTVSGELVPYGSSYTKTITFDEDQTLSLVFNVKTFVVTIKQPQGIASPVIGDVVYSGGSSIDNYITYGSHTLKITAPANYYIVSVVGNTVNYTNDDPLLGYKEFELNITADCEIEIKYQRMPEYAVTINTIIDGVTENVVTDSVIHGNSYSISTPVVEGYYVTNVRGTVNGVTVQFSNEDNYTVENYTETVSSLTDVITLDVYYEAIPTFNVTVNASDADAGTVTGGGTVYSGSSTIISATANEGYRFTGWTASNEDYRIQSGTLETPSLSIIANGDVEFTANFAASKGTVNVSAAEGGTVDTDGGDITYPETVTATATANTSEGYIFTHWTVKSEGKEGTDYAIVRENNNVIEVRILTNGTVVDVVANFANAQKIKIYTYTDAGFNKLHLTETEGTDTKDIYNSTQTAILFGDETWFTPTTGELTLTAGYNDAITAQLFSSAAEVTDGTVIYVELSDAWTKTEYAYGAPHIAVTASSNSGWSDNITSSDTTGVNQNCYIPQNDTYIGGGVQVSGNIYKFVIPNTSLNNLKNYGFMIYSKQWTSVDFWELNTTHGTYSTSANLYKISENKTKNDDRKTYCFSISASGDMPTQTDPINIVNALYNGNEWLGKDEVWIYFDSNGGYTATNRRVLNNYVSTGLVKSAYNGGKNDKGYTDETWTAFVNAYDAASATLGAGASSQGDIDGAYTTLKAAYEALKLTDTVTLIGSHGAEPYTNTADYYGKISFPELTGISTKTDGNIGDDNTNYYHYPTDYLTGSVTRGATIQINTQIQPDYLDDYVVYGWVVNGTEFITATEDIATDGLYIGSYTCSNNATIVPVYFRADTIENWQENDNVVKVYAKITDNIGKWGNFISAYTWTADQTMNVAYRQFGHWTGQLMIPDTSTPGMYYTYVEKTNPDNANDPTTGITFVNYGNNNPINNDARYQAYDYYEFIELAEQDFDNIVFELKTFEGNENYPSESKATLSDYNFDYFVDFSGNRIDINRKELTEEQMALDPALYVVRTGPVKNNEGAGAGWGSLEGSDFYVDAYLYKPDGSYIGRCKTYELTNLEQLAKPTSEGGRGIDLTTEEYAGKPVMVDYASLTTDSGGNKRYDGEWYGTKYGFTNVTISVEVAFLNEDGTVTYYSDEKTPNDIEGVGSAYINGEASQEVPHGSEGHIISANVPDGNDFVGWCIATKNSDGTITIDPAAPLFIERSATVDASSDAIYVAVFKEHPEGAFTVNNYYYTYDDFKGQTMSPYLPPVFGGDTSYSIRDVEIDRIYNSYTKESNDVDKDRAGTYTQTLDSVNVGDILRITIYTKPTFPRDYVYAWYIQANDSYGINFEEIGTTATNPSGTLMQEESFTFDYEVKEGVSSITIYSDVVHTTDTVTLTYIYTNRFGIEQKYIVKHKLTQDELNNGYKPSDETIRGKAPAVDDLFKDLEWNVSDAESDATNFTLRAREDNLFNIFVTVNKELVLDTQMKYNEPMEIKAYELVDNLDRSKPGIWFLDANNDGKFVEGTDTILGYGPYYGLVVTGHADIHYTNDYELVTQIVLADAVYGAEKVTDENGVENVNKVYVDYLISYLINVFSGQYIDLNEDGVQDPNEPTIYEPNNASNPCSVKAIREAGYTIDYGMVLELLNMFSKDEAANQSVKETYYGTNLTLTDKIQALLEHKKALDDAADTAGLENLAKFGWGETGYNDTHFFLYEAEDYGFSVTNKNRVLMTFDYDNTDAMRMRHYNVMAYLVIADEDGNNPNYYYSNQATLNIQEADKIEN